jgi:peptidoglycan-associated lipoprotein
MRSGAIIAATLAATFLAACSDQGVFAARRASEARAAAEAAAQLGPSTIVFTPGKWDLPSDATPVLRRASAWLLGSEERMILIEGQGDARGTREYAVALGARRAENVKLYLMGLGVPSDQIVTVSWGRERLASTAISSRRVLERIAESPERPGTIQPRGPGLAEVQN